MRAPPPTASSLQLLLPLTLLARNERFTCPEHCTCSDSNFQFVEQLGLTMQAKENNGTLAGSFAQATPQSLSPGAAAGRPARAARRASDIHLYSSAMTRYFLQSTMVTRPDQSTHAGVIA